MRRLYDWVLSWAGTPYGAWALAVLALAESSVFPIPPDPLLVALCLGAPAASMRFAALTTAASVLGGVIGYGMVQAGAPKLVRCSADGQSREARAALAQRRALLDSVDVIASYVQEMSDFLRTSDITASRAFIRSFVKEIAVRPGTATIRYTIPTPADSPIAGGDAAEISLPEDVRNTVSVGTPERTRTSAFGSGGRHSIR